MVDTYLGMRTYLSQVANQQQQKIYSGLAFTAFASIKAYLTAVDSLQVICINSKVPDK